MCCFALSIVTGGSVTVTGAGLVLTIAAAAMWASSNIVVKKLQATGLRYSTLALIVWSSLISAFAFGAVSWLFDDAGARWQWLQARPSSWMSAIYLGWLASALAYWLWTTQLNRHPASRVAPFSLGVPVVGMLSGILLLDERVTGLQWLGTALVMSALVFVVLSAVRSLKTMTRRYRGGAG